MTKTVGKKKWQMKAPAVKFAIAHLHKHAFCGVHKYFIILLDGSVLFVSYLPFNDYSTNSTILQRLFNVKLMKKWVVLHGLKLWKLNSFLEPFRWRTIEFIRKFLRVRLKILHLCASQTIGQFWAQCTVWSKRKVFLRFDSFSKVLLTNLLFKKSFNKQIEKNGFTIWRIPILSCWLFKRTFNFLLHREKSKYQTNWKKIKKKRWIHDI